MFIFLSIERKKESNNVRAKKRKKRKDSCRVMILAIFIYTPSLIYIKLYRENQQTRNITLIFIEAWRIHN